MCNKLRFLTLAAAALLAIPGSSSHAAITYSSWYASIGAGGIAFPNHTSSPNQVRLHNTDGAAGPFDDTYGNAGGGGEYRVESVSANSYISYTDGEGTARIYKTFCLEVGEHFIPGVAYNVSVDPAAYFGGNVVPDGGFDFLDASTAVLYGRYFDGTLDNVTLGAFSYTADASLNALQKAIWAIEDNPASLSGLALALYNYGVTTASAAERLYYSDNVAVLNLWDVSHVGPGDPTLVHARQSQLMWTGDPSRIIPPVPEPASLVLWGLGVVAAAGFRSCRQKSMARC